MQNPRQYKIPDWFLNRQKDVKDGKYSQVGGSPLVLGLEELTWCILGCESVNYPETPQTLQASMKTCCVLVQVASRGSVAVGLTQG